MRPLGFVRFKIHKRLLLLILVVFCRRSEWIGKWQAVGCILLPMPRTDDNRKDGSDRVKPARLLIKDRATMSIGWPQQRPLCGRRPLAAVVLGRLKVERGRPGRLVVVVTLTRLEDDSWGWAPKLFSFHAPGSFKSNNKLNVSLARDSPGSSWVSQACFCLHRARYNGYLILVGMYHATQHRSG